MTERELELLEIINQLAEANAELSKTLWELTKPRFEIKNNITLEDKS